MRCSIGHNLDRRALDNPLPPPILSPPQTVAQVAGQLDGYVLLLAEQARKQSLEIPLGRPQLLPRPREG